ncbi:putative transcription factor C2H2 family [Helianthus anomalus]
MQVLRFTIYLQIYLSEISLFIFYINNYFQFCKFKIVLMMTDPNIIFEEVSPTTLLDSNRFTCDVCLQGFPRKQNLSLHQRVHNLPFTLKTRAPNDPVPRKKYLCPEPTCVHHIRSHAIGDFGGLKKHYLRKHSTHKNYKCVTCSKAYSVHADLKAHVRICAGKNNLRHSGPRLSR